MSFSKWSVTKFILVQKKYQLRDYAMSDIACSDANANVWSTHPASYIFNNNSVNVVVTNLHTYRGR